MVSPLLDKALSDAILHEAWYRVRANKGCAGADGQSINNFEKRLEENLSLLRQEVLTGTHVPRPLLIRRIPKKKGGFRTLAIPAVRDRVLQTAVALVLTPILESEFEDSSFAYRKNRSVDKAIERIVHLRNQGYKWVVDADIEAFFDSVDRKILLKELEKLIHDKSILTLVDQWLKNEAVDKDIRYCFIKGIPQGSPISPLLANLYLDTLDEELLAQNLKLVRFADDFIILAKDRESAQDALEFTEDILEALKLELHKDKTQIVDFNQGFRFLGVQFIRTLAFKEKSGDVESSNAFLHHANPIEEAFRESGILPAHPKEPEETLGTIPISPHELEEAVPTGHDPRLRTLYLFRHGYILGKESERFVIKHRGKVLQEVPAIKVDQIMVFGNGQITTQAMHFCLRERIPIFLLSGHGRFYGVIDSFDTEPVLLHRDQFARASDPDFCLDLAKAFVRGKVANSRVVLMRYARKRFAPELKAGTTTLKSSLSKIAAAKSLDELRGIEGSAAKAYFSAISRTLPKTWKFKARLRQPPPDPVNSMLSYGYTLLFYNIYSLLRARGLNPHVGFLHPMRPGHPALVSDVMEEFRAIVVDAVVLNLVLNSRIDPRDFTCSEGNGCSFSKKAKKKFIKVFENKLNSKIKHPVSGLNLDYRRCIEHQASHLARTIRGMEPKYKPFILK